MAKQKRDYKRERELAIKRGETGCGSKSGDATRHRARRKVEKKLGRKLSTNEHVDHKKPLNKGGSNSVSNLRVRSKESNSRAGGENGNHKNKGPRRKGALSK